MKRKYPENRKKHSNPNCKCASCKSVRGEYNGTNNPGYIDGRKSAKYYCIEEGCTNEISYMNWNSGNRRCRHCYKEWLTIPENTSNYKIGLFSDNPNKCIDCGKLINYKAKRCKSCARKYQYKIEPNTHPMLGRKGNLCPMFGKIVHGKGSYYKKIWMRSTWEIAYAKWLDKQHIKWQYEPKTFELGNTTYTPDFYIPKIDTYIEIKGWWREDAKKKFKLFKKLYSKIKIKVISDRKFFNSLEA